MVYNSYLESFVVIDGHLKPFWGKKKWKNVEKIRIFKNNFWPLDGVKSKFWQFWVLIWVEFSWRHWVFEILGCLSGKCLRISNQIIRRFMRCKKSLIHFSISLDLNESLCQINVVLSFLCSSYYPGVGYVPWFMLYYQVLFSVIISSSYSRKGSRYKLYYIR